ncbi:hypothetical protein [Streptomyces sp. NPDC023588]|uniref:hypothetical protein n=1 Tax=Streptomyces sp. NPDC023588 TaxID=3154907 RepID=UPI0033DD4721
MIALIAVARLVEDRQGRIGVAFNGIGVLLGAAGIAALSGALPHFTGYVIVLPAAGILLAGFVWWQTRATGALASPSGVTTQAHIGYFLATSLANAGVVALLMGMGYIYY